MVKPLCVRGLLADQSSVPCVVCAPCVQNIAKYQGDPEVMKVRACPAAGNLGSCRAMQSAQTPLLACADAAALHVWQQTSRLKLTALLVCFVLLLRCWRR